MASAQILNIIPHGPASQDMRNAQVLRQSLSPTSDCAIPPQIHLLDFLPGVIKFVSCLDET